MIILQFVVFMLAWVGSQLLMRKLLSNQAPLNWQKMLIEGAVVGVLVLTITHFMS